MTNLFVSNPFFLASIAPKRGGNTAKEKGIIKMAGAIRSGLSEGRDETIWILLSTGDLEAY